MTCGSPAITGRGLLSVLNVDPVKWWRSHSSNCDTYSSRGGNGAMGGLMGVLSAGSSNISDDRGCNLRLMREVSVHQSQVRAYLQRDVALGSHFHGKDLLCC